MLYLYNIILDINTYVQTGDINIVIKLPTQSRSRLSNLSKQIMGGLSDTERIFSNVIKYYSRK